MRSINQYINEKLKIRKSNNPYYKYFPDTKEELQELLNHLIEERGNEGDFNDIDTSKITDMSKLFDGMKKFNGNISNWDVSNVRDMKSMFMYCESFNGDISNWDVSNVTTMRFMFYGCKSFNQDISNWDVSKVDDVKNIFYNCPIEEKYKPKFK